MPSRFTAFGACVLVFLVGLILVPWHLGWALFIIGGGLTAIGVLDLLQTHHAIRRNYPVIGHIRWMAELVRPEIRQHLLEADEDAAPFSRSQRSLVYKRSKGIAGERPFGTLRDVYRDGFEYIAHSARPAKPADPATFRVSIGGPQCAKPYAASLFNISAMSFGSLSANAIRALNAGAKKGNFYHDTGEGSISRYHREMGGDIVWELVAATSAAAPPTGISIPTCLPNRRASIRSR